MSLWGPLIGMVGEKLFPKMAQETIGTVATTAGNYLDRKHNEKREDTALSRAIADGRRAGIHPLASIGASNAARS